MFICMLIGLSFWVVPAWADEEAKETREIINKWQDVVITVKLVVEMYESENNIEVLATIIDSSGLAVLSLSSFDHSSMGFGSDASRVEIKVKDVKMFIPDGDEISAKIVLRDRDLDLAFVCPIDKLDKAIPALDLTEHGKLDIMDQVLILSRLGKFAGYVPLASLGRIHAVIKKPRVLYLPGLDGFVSGLGTPVFSLDGEVVGILLLRVTRTQGFGAGDMFGGIGGIGTVPIILPAEEILEVVKKASLIK